MAEDARSTLMPEYLPIALRVHTERDPSKKPKWKGGGKPPPRWGSIVILLDTETWTDTTQSLRFGTALICRWRQNGTLKPVGEYLFYADDLRTRDPDGFEVFEYYARTHKQNGLMPLSLPGFLDHVLWPACKTHALIVAFNLPFDLSRLALEWSEAQGKYAGGFSLTLWHLRKRAGFENRHRPRVRIKHIDNKRALMGLSQPGRESGEVRARLLDLKTLTYVLTDRGHSLKSACEAFQTEHRKLDTDHGAITPEYIDYNRNDVLLLKELLEKLRAEFDLHQIDTDPTKALSPAAIAKGYLTAMGITPPKSKFDDLPKEALAIPMLAYHGGRAECHVRMLPVPIVHCDTASMYPTVHILMDLWPVTIAKKARFIDATREVQEFLNVVTLQDLLNKSTWAKLNFFAYTVPERDIFTVRSAYTDGSGAFTNGTNILSAGIEIPFAGPELVATKVRTGKTPKITKAYKIVAEGIQDGLRTARLRGAVEIDPQKNPFQALVESRNVIKNDPTMPEKERKRLDLSCKVVANSGAYGVNAELRRVDLPGKKTEVITVYGLNGPFRARTRAPEEPGLFYFPPIASLVTAGARLMLTIYERLVAEAGATYAFCDTDSIAIVATEHGGNLRIGDETVHALSWAEVEQLRNTVASLNPYDPAKVPGGSILKLEPENFDPETGDRRQLYAYAISAKRYALFNLHDGGFTLRKWTEHALGFVQNPSDPGIDSKMWIREIWNYLIARALGIPAEPPSWFDLPALSRVTATSPELLSLFDQPGTKAGSERIRPWNFLLAPQVAPFGHPPGVAADKFQLYGSFTTDPKQWLARLWTERYSRKRYAITTTHDPSPSVVRVKSYRDVIEGFASHPEAKSADEHGLPCSRATRGILHLRNIRVAYVRYTGKESNLLEDIEMGLVHDWDLAREVYDDPQQDWWRCLVVPVLKEMVRGRLAQISGLCAREVRRICNGRVIPLSDVREKLRRAAADYARAQLGPNVPTDDLAACAAYLDQVALRYRQANPG